MSAHTITGTQRPVGRCIPAAAIRQIINMNTFSPSRGVAHQQQNYRSKTKSKHMRMTVKASSATNDLGIESVGGIRTEVEAAIEAALDNCLTETDVGIGKKYRVML
jgi:hypothetical protein